MAALTYKAALEALADRGRFGIRLGLGRTRALLRELGDPQRSRGALVAGTNGKGSVLALAGAALEAAGYRVATTPKPHLVSYRERLQIDGRPVDPVTFARLVEEILPVADRVARRHGDRPSSSCSPRLSSAGSRRSVPTSRSSKSDSEAGSMRRTHGTAGSRRSPTSRSITWSSSGRRSRRLPAKRPRSSNAAMSR